MTSEAHGEVFVIDAAKSSAIGQFKTAPRPRSIGFLPDGSRAYVTCETANAVDGWTRGGIA